MEGRLFKTRSGTAGVRGTDLVVERRPSSYLSGWYVRKVVDASRARAAWNLLGPVLFVGTAWQFGRVLLDGYQPGLREFVAVVLAALLPVAVAVHLYREALTTTVVPLSDIDRAEIHPSERTLRLLHDEETTLELRSDDDVEAARRQLRLRGVDVGLPGEGAEPGADGAARGSEADERGRTGRERSHADRR